MIVEKIMGTGTLRVRDTASNLDLECEIRYMMSCSVSIVDENAYNGAVADEPIKTILIKAMAQCFDEAYKSVYPDGVEFSDLIDSSRMVKDEIKVRVEPVLEPYGLQPVNMLIDRIVLPEDKETMFRNAKYKSPSLFAYDGPGMNFNDKSNVAKLNCEWVCTCGHINTGKFCTECGAKNTIAF